MALYDKNRRRSFKRWWLPIVASAVVVLGAGSAVPAAHAAALQPTQSLGCATNPIQVPSFGVDDTDGFWLRLDTSLANSTNPPWPSGINADASNNELQLTLTDSTSGCRFNAMIDNNGTFTPDSTASDMPAGTYSVTQVSGSTYYATVWVQKWDSTTRTYYPYEGNVPCTLGTTTFTLTGAAGNTTGAVNGQMVCSGTMYQITGTTTTPTKGTCCGSNDSTFSGSGQVTPELTSAELFITGLVPIIGLLAYRKRRTGPASGHDTPGETIAEDEIPS